VSALREAMAGRTTFVVSSRLSLLRRADLILVLEDGQVTLTGTHAKLVRWPGLYRETALLQIMDLGEGETSNIEHPTTDIEPSTVGPSCCSAWLRGSAALPKDRPLRS
jgi:hypothetical protein